MMLRTTVLTLALALCSSALAAEVNLTAVQFPDKQTIDVGLARTVRTPTLAKAEASVKYADGQARVKISFKGMEPAILFGGDVSSYVIWAVTRDGVTENLGEMVVSESGDSGSQEAATGQKIFALMVTAEPYYLAGKPGELVMFTSMAPPAGKAQSSSFSFSGFRTLAGKADVDSITGLTYKDKTPVPLVQAQRALALAERIKADQVNPRAIEAAKLALEQATNSTKPGGSARAVTDYSRRAVTLSAEAIRDAYRKMEAEAAAAAAAKRQAELDAMAGKAASAEAARQQSEIAKAAVQAERDELARRLTAAMSQIMETRESARGAVMSLPGISFDTGKATLKPAAQITLAKLAGMALVFPDVNMRVEGYTDSRGSAATNQKLSEDRAKAVYDFLKEQGIAGSRLSFQGRGPADPVADNATEDGRARNRRVEIVAARGEIKPVN